MTRQIASVGELFTATWTNFKARALPILGVAVITMLISFTMQLALIVGTIFGAAFFSGINLEQVQAIFQTQPPQIEQLWPLLTQLSALIPFVGLALLLVMIVGMWGQAATLAVVVDERLTIRGALAAGWRYLWPVAWVSLLFGAIVMVGFLLFVIPGIIFAIWFSFSFYILIEERKPGLAALMASKEYVRGYWFNTFGKMVVIWLAAFVVMLLLGVIPFVGSFLAMIVATPFFMLFNLQLYRDLKAAKGGEMAESELGAKIIWGVVGAIGMALPVAWLVALVIFAPGLSTLVQESSTEWSAPAASDVTPKQAQGPQRGQISEQLSAQLQSDGPEAGQPPATSPPAVSLPPTAPSAPVSEALPEDVPPTDGGTAATGTPSPAGQVPPSSSGAAIPAPAAEEPASSEPGVVLLWHDPPADVASAGLGPWLDLVEVSVSAQDKALLLTVVLNTQVAEFYQQAAATQAMGQMVGFYLDSDMNPATGREVVSGLARGGYDVGINVLLEAKSDPRVHPVHVSLTKMNAQGISSLGKLVSTQVVISANKLLITLPYDQVELQPGSQVRLCYREFAQSQGYGLSKDKIINLQSPK